MITISRRLARRIRAVFRRALRWSSRGIVPSVVFTASESSLRVRAFKAAVAITYEEAGRFEPAELAVPIELLGDCEAARDDLVTLEAASDNSVSARWREAGIDRVSVRDRLADLAADAWPKLPDKLYQNPNRLISGLRNAAETTDRESSRYALGHIQLRGQRGEIVSTDGNQLLVQRGFKFPWNEELLIPPNRVFGHAEFDKAERVLIGSCGGWVTLCVGPWTIQVKVLHEGRFPKTDAIVPKAEYAAASCRLNPIELERLVQSLKILPGADEPCSPVTIELNGHFAVRAKSKQMSKPIEIKLAEKRPVGQSMRIASNRQYVELAARLGLRDFYLFEPESPLLAAGDDQLLVWMPLAPSFVISGREDDILSKPLEIAA